MRALKIDHNISNTITMSTSMKSHVMEKLLIWFTVVFLCLNMAECTNDSKNSKKQVHYSALNCRKHSAMLTDFGGKGDGTTSNTAAFKAAIANLSKVASNGGAELIVPPGKWLTGSINLISHFTLYIHKDAVLLASQGEKDYPLIDPLPSYGRGIDANTSAKRFASLIFGTNLTDVVVTGGNGTINGQGETWWKKFKSKSLKYTRPFLVEILYSNHVQISHLTMINSPAWNVHPTYCRNVIIENLTIIAPIDSPNTDGINPDSCRDTRIRDSYIVSGDDCIAVKSGWDQHGINVNLPTQQLSIKRLTCISPDSAVIAVGSEMSGGIQDVRAEQIHAVNSESGVRIKTGPGRGAYVKDIYVKDMFVHTMKYVFWMTGDYKSHPDDGYDPKALPEIKNINFKNVIGTNVTMVGDLIGIKGDSFTGICVSNVTVEMAVKGSADKKKARLPWNCTDIAGTSSHVSPKPCDLLPEKKGSCFFPRDTLPIDKVELRTCYVGKV